MLRRNGVNSSIKTLLTTPSSIKTISQAKQLHALFVTTFNLYSPPESSYLTTALISIYSNFNLLNPTLTLFNTLQYTPSTRAYKHLIKCYASNHHFLEALLTFNEMKALGRYPDRNVFPSVFKACTHLKDLKTGEALHGCVIRLGVNDDLFTCNALMHMYAKLDGLFGVMVFDKSPDLNVNLGEGEMEKMRSNSVSKVFETMPIKDVVSWNTVIGGCLQNGMYKEAVEMLRKMGKANLKPDSFTLSSLLPTFAKDVNILRGKEIHGYVIRHGIDTDVYIASSLIDMYANCTLVADSFKVFNLLPQHDDVLWNSIIAGCVQNGMFDEGLNLFREMLNAKIKPVEISFSSIIPACGHLMGKQLHGYIIRLGFDDNMYIASSLVDMYSKCGNLKISKLIFDKMEIKDTVAWTAMIMGYALHGHARDAILLFEKMKKPNSVAFVAVLTACSHGGLVDEALKYLTIMTRKYGIVPQLEHYAAVADVLGRAGRLEEAYKFIVEMDIEPTGIVWSTLLSACRVHKNIQVAEKVAHKIFVIDPEYTGSYAMLSSMYSNAGRWNDATKLRVKMKRKGMIKKAACSWVEVNNEIHL